LGAKLRENAFILHDIGRESKEDTKKIDMNAHDLHDQSVGYTPSALHVKYLSSANCGLLPVLPPRLAHFDSRWPDNCVIENIERVHTKEPAA